MHARYAAHARTFFPQRFVSIENKGLKIQLPKLKVASSSLVARSIRPQEFFNLLLKINLIVISVPRILARRILHPRMSASRVERFGLPDEMNQLFTPALLFLLMLVVALDREAGVNPVLLTTGVVTHVGITQRRQFTGGVL